MDKAKTLRVFAALGSTRLRICVSSKHSISRHQCSITTCGRQLVKGV